MENAEKELLTFQSTTQSLNDARIAVVEFLDVIEVEQRLAVIPAVKTLQRALKLYEAAIRFLGGASARSLLGDYYDELKIAADNEKSHVSEMFKAVLKQDVTSFNKHYQSYVKSLL